MPDSQPSKRRPLMAGNWKMYKTPAETDAFLRDLVAKLPSPLECDVVVCPPFPSLVVAQQRLKGTSIGLGGQTLHELDEGAYTGEVSGPMLVGAGCQYVIVGHSERRQHYGETNTSVNKKVFAAIRHGLTPIVCVGESLQEREANVTLKVVEAQVKEGLHNLPSSDMKKLVLAYEPVWAIGTGKTATPEQAQEVHLAIRDILKDQYGSLISLGVRILYGGSVKPDNIANLMSCPDIDGGLVGGACLKLESFLDIIKAAGKKFVPK